MNHANQFKRPTFLSPLELKFCGHYERLFDGKDRCYISLEKYYLSLK